MNYNTKYIFVAFLLIFSLSGRIMGQLQLQPDNIDKIIDAMTLEEKVTICMGTGDADVWRFYGIKPDIKLNGQASSTHAISRLGIRSTILTDGPAGLRIDTVQKGIEHPTYSTAFPTATALASSWNTTLLNDVGSAIGKETLEYGSDLLLGPGMNIQMNPLTGRNYEYYSEDPLVSGEMAAAMVNGIQSSGVGACIKHFVANNIETNRRTINAVVSQRALREIYLRGFEIAVKKSHPWMIMTSYNKLNGFYTPENKDLLQGIVRNEWGFDGLFVTDWVSGRDYIAQMKAGNELLMPGVYQKEAIMNAVETGMLDEEVINRNAKKVLEYIVKTPGYKKYRKTSKPDLEKHAAISKNAALESMVLLKNDNNTLPIAKVKNVALFGKTSYYFIAGGTGSGRVNYKHAVSLLEGLNNANYKIWSQTHEYYKAYADSLQKNTKAAIKNTRKNIIDFSPEAFIPSELIVQSEKKNDIAIITFGRNAGEQWDRQVDDYFNLSVAEKKLLNDVCEVYHRAGKKVVVVLNIGGPIETASWRDMPDAILLCWQTGQEGGHALVDILKGNANPSGKLVVTFPARYEDVPSSKTFPGEPKNNPVNAFYEDGIYIGYRYYDSFNVKPSYEFGYGMSYTSFDYSPVQILKNENGNIRCSVTITNSGKRAGKEVAQLYLAAPQNEIEKPVHELKSFAKTALLKPGQSETVYFDLDKKNLASFVTAKSQWIAGAGEYTIKIGASSRDIRATNSFTLDKAIIAETVNDVLYPNILLQEISVKKKPQHIDFEDLIPPLLEH